MYNILTSQTLATAKQFMDISLEDLIDDFFFCHQKACELVLNVIKDLPYTHDRPPASNLAEASGAKGRQLWLTKCTESEILPYCIQLLLAALKVSIMIVLYLSSNHQVFIKLAFWKALHLPSKIPSNYFKETYSYHSSVEQL